MQSLRSVGYDFQSAIADLVDNSIAAGATTISLHGEWAVTDSYFRITDNGCGMSLIQLVEAMRLGTSDPRAARGKMDLGRFGLGLKTASLSQCRHLIVSTKQAGGETHIRRWDLDAVSTLDDWTLLKGAADINPELLAIPGESGTVVMWRQMDRVIEQARDSEATRDQFFENLASARDHIGTVFHRFLTGSAKISITMNNHAIEPWDPFFVNHPATQEHPQEELGPPQAPVAVRSFVVPHVSKLSSEAHAAGGGKRGWNGQQGFYVYRNRRLLVAGDWLGLGFHQEEHYKLARLAIDISNATDAEWDIDIKKSSARPPDYLKDALKRIAKATRKHASEVYRQRGQTLARTIGQPELLWLRRVTAGQISYAINRAFPLVEDVLAGSGHNLRKTKTLLRLIEEAVPVRTIIIDASENPERDSQPFGGKATKEMIAAARLVYEVLRPACEKTDIALARILAMEPFTQFRSAIQAAFEAEGGWK